MAGKDMNIVANFIGEQFSHGVKKAEHELKHLEQTAKSIKPPSLLSKFGFTAAGIGIAAAGVALIEGSKRVIDMDTALIKLRNTGKLSASEMMTWKNQIFDVALASHTTTDDVTKLSTAALASSHNAKFVSSEMGFMANMLNATGADADQLGESLGEMSKESGLTGQAFEEMVGKLVSTSHMAGVEESFTKMLPNFPKMIRTIKTLNPNASMEQIRSYLTMGMFSPSPEAFDKAMRKMQTTLSTKAKQFLKLSPDVAKNLDFKGVIDAIDKASPDIQKRMKAMTEIFGKDAFNLNYMKEHWEEFDNAVKNANVGDALAMGAAKAQGLAGAMNVLSVMGDKFADAGLTPALQEISKAITSMPKDEMNDLASAFGAIGTSIAKLIEGLIVAVNYWSAASEEAGGIFAFLTGQIGFKDLKRMMDQDDTAADKGLNHLIHGEPKTATAPPPGMFGNAPVTNVTVNLDKDGKVKSTETTVKTNKQMQVVKHGASGSF